MGRDYAGIAYVSSRAFPERGSSVGAVATAIEHAIRDGSLPCTNAEIYLRPNE